MSGLEAFVPQIIGGLASTFIGQLFKSDKEEPATQKVEEPTAMPTAEGQDQKEAKRRAMIEQQRRRGRAAAVLTDQNDTLG